MSECRQEELLIACIAGMLADVAHVAVGARSPVPGAAALLARALGGGSPRVSLLGSARHNPFTDGGRELFDCAAQGRIDAFFLGGAQIDGEANVNLVCVGEHAHPRARFPGSFGSAYLYFLVPRVILFTMEHTPRVLVPRVDFVSAPGSSPPGIYRRGGPHALITPRCLFRFADGGFTLASVHPGHDAAEIAAHTGFAYATPPDGIPTTPAPDAATLALMRGPVAQAIAETYPAFARRVFGAAVH